MTITLEDIRNFKLCYNEKNIEEFLNLSSMLAVEQGKTEDRAFFAVALELYKECIQSNVDDSLTSVILTSYHINQQKDLVVALMDNILTDLGMLKALRACETLGDLITYCRVNIKDYVDNEVSKLMTLIREEYGDNQEFKDKTLSLVHQNSLDILNLMPNFIDNIVDDEETMSWFETKLTEVLFKLLINYYVIPASYDKVLVQLEGIGDKNLYDTFRFDALADNKIMLPEAIRPKHLEGFKDIWLQAQKEMSANGKLSIDTLLSCEYCQLCISSSVSLEELERLVYGFKDNERDNVVREHLKSFVAVIEDVNLQTLYTFKDYMDRLTEDTTKVLFENMEETKSKIKALVEEDKKEEINNVLNETVVNSIDLDEMSKTVANTLNRVSENTRGVSLLLSDNVCKNMKYCNNPKQLRKFGIVVNNHLFSLSKFSEKETLIIFLDLVHYLCETLIKNVEECFEETKGENREIVETLVDKVKFSGHSIKSYTELNKLAKKAGYDKVRQKGDHGIFKKLDGTVVVIPQGRSIGKGLNIKIQKDIERQ